MAIDPYRRYRLARENPAYLARLEEADAVRDVFAADLAVRPMKWSAYYLSRMLRLTGERPERVAEMRSILGALGLGCRSQWLEIGGVFDHGDLWGRDRMPLMVVGHPYQIDPDERALLVALARFPGLAVAVDDRPSYYGFGTRHVRVELAEVRRPFVKMPSTPKTRAAARAARQAFAELSAEGPNDGRGFDDHL